MKNYSAKYYSSVPDQSNNADGIFFQPKLTINQPNDIYEQEADAMADKVMRMEQRGMQLQSLPVTAVQKKCAHCKEEENQLQRKEINGERKPAANNLESYVGSLSSSGQSLPKEVRNFYEPRFGYDFGNVKVHTGSVAAKSASSINALAYTSGNNIVFNQGQYDPETGNGKKLLAHELTHVVQQASGQLQMAQRSEDAAEAEPMTEESPCEKASLKNQKPVPCPGGSVEVTPCKWTMFKNAGTCDLFISYTNAEGIITVESLDPGAVTEAVPSKRCISFKISCGTECSGNGLIKWGPPCIS